MVNADNGKTYFGESDVYINSANNYRVLQNLSYDLFKAIYLRDESFLFMKYFKMPTYSALG
ncbi:hypothetical protein [uncultured Muribaculum sp.]|uniref:hypothetical protein n=1 Tax=uncultured Muribaculum sp. TaxID=1918613 RepID=UPI003460EE5A